ncbi:hypothetical protein LG634_37275 [Streptomyces bambusae]|uniref:hypothetical protein n=1 Tax=Streptomyces bambusae TaxID=1550616 RepID=UPI001CFF8DCA|nr:hypothetical protein [Streptomyces bambusae]MCB5170431.1 hypothetical protein [Streptomyces bambusae]
MKIKLKAALVAVCAPAILALASAPAHALPGWDLTHTQADIAGTWARGEFWKGSDGRWYIDGDVRDTLSDGKGAALRLVALYNDGGSRPEKVWNQLGHGKDKHFAFNFAGNMKSIYLQECQLVVKDPVRKIVDYGECASVHFIARDL